MFPYARERISQKIRVISAVWARALINSSSPILGSKNFKACRFEGAPNYLPARGAHVSAPPPIDSLA